MAKSSNIIGTIAGKAGSMVFSKGPDGSTIMRAYQPQVANPRTDGQQEQRAKVVLAGKVSKITPAEMLTGLSKGSTLKNRSAYTANLINAAVVTEVEGKKVASVQPQRVIFSEGLTPMAATLGNVVLAATSVTIALSGVIADGRNGARFIAMVIDEEVDGYYRSAAFADVVFTENMTSAVINLPFALKADQAVLVYACPFRLSTSTRRTKSAGVWIDDDIKAELGLASGVTADFGMSIYKGMSVFAQG